MRMGLVAGAIGAVLLTGCTSAPPKPHVNYDPATPEFYVQDVEPIFHTYCSRCHGGMNRKGEYSMQTRAAMLRGGKHGVAIVPGDPAASLLVRLIRHEGPRDNPMPMPNKGKKISEADIATVERWVQAGAIMPADAPKP
jgi:cytochrome c